MVKPKKKKADSEETYTPAHKPLPAAILAKGMGVKESDLQSQKLNEIAQLLWFPEHWNEEEKIPKIVRALEFFEGLEPHDAAEGMLAAQMVGTHFAALECLKRAALANQTFAGRDMALKHAQKLMSLYGQQLTTLNKHRGKGQQKVTVEHVNVEAGGQAIVGNVEAGQAGNRRDANNAIEHGPEVPLPGVKSKTKSVRRRAK